MNSDTSHAQYSHQNKRFADRLDGSSRATMREIEIRRGELGRRHCIGPHASGHNGLSTARLKVWTTGVPLSRAPTQAENAVWMRFVARTRVHDCLEVPVGRLLANRRQPASLPMRSLVRHQHKRR